MGFFDSIAEYVPLAVNVAGSLFGGGGSMSGSDIAYGNQSGNIGPVADGGQYSSMLSNNSGNIGPFASGSKYSSALSGFDGVFKSGEKKSAGLSTMDYIGFGMEALNTAFANGMVDEEEYFNSKEYLEDQAAHQIEIYGYRYDREAEEGVKDREADKLLQQLRNEGSRDTANIAAGASRDVANISAESRKDESKRTAAGKLRDLMLQRDQYGTQLGAAGITAGEEDVRGQIAQLIAALQSRGAMGQKGFQDAANMLGGHIK